MPIGGELEKWSKGEALKADKLSEPPARINRLQAQVDAIDQSRESGAFCPPIARARFVGVIRDSGPDDEDDYSDARYWVERLSPSQQTDPTQLAILNVEPIENNQQYITATNVAECTFDSSLTGSTHNLAAGDVVEVFLLFLGTDPPTKFWCFDKVVPRPLLVKVYKDGGVAGSDSTSCTFTYTIKDWKTGTISIATLLTPLRPRYANCEYDQPADGTYGLAFYDGSAWQLYEAVMEKPKGDTVTYLTQWRIDGATMKFQYKTQQALVLELGTESGWTDAATGVACP